MADSELKQGDESLSKESSIFSKIQDYFGGNDEEGKVKNRSRRVFIKGAVGTAAAIALSNLGQTSETAAPVVPTDALETDEEPTAQEEQAEKEKSNKPLILDFFNTEVFFDKAIADYAESKGLNAQAIKDKLNISAEISYDDLKSVVPENEEENILLLLTALKTIYSSHGKDVSDVRQHTANFFGDPESQSEFSSIEAAIHVDSVTTDTLGNPTVWLNISPEVIDQLVSQSSESVINMSFQLGKVGITYELFKEVRANPEIGYPTTSRRGRGGNITESFFDADGNEITKEEHDVLLAKAEEKRIDIKENPIDRSLIIEDGYVGENTYSNLSHMAELASMHQDKIFLVAAGNPTRYGTRYLPDIREAKAKLMEEEKWPQNLFVIGFIGIENGFEGEAQRGADYYVSYKDIELIADKNMASSFATPMVTEIVRQLKINGLSEPEDVRGALNLFSNSFGSDAVNVIDFAKAKREFQDVYQSENMRAE